MWSRSACALGAKSPRAVQPREKKRTTESTPSGDLADSPWIGPRARRLLPRHEKRPSAAALESRLVGALLRGEAVIGELGSGVTAYRSHAPIFLWLKFAGSSNAAGVTDCSNA
jgi:hypothetical protein